MSVSLEEAIEKIAAMTEERSKLVKKRHKHADVIIAWANGEEVEWYDPLEKKWRPLTPPDMFNGEYRIKPKTVKKEGWVNVYTGFSGGLIVAHTGGPVYRTEKTADLSNHGNRVACVHIEWEEEV